MKNLILKKVFIDTFLGLYICLWIVDVIGILDISNLTMSTACVIIYSINVEKYFNYRLSEKKYTFLACIENLISLMLPWIILMILNLLDIFETLEYMNLLYQSFNVLLLAGTWYFVKRFYDIS